jgi:putative hydrolase of the HAD superfamily
VDIVAVKDPQTYEDVVARHGLDRARTWMIGNSPKSDIIAARAAGLRAVFIPNANTWAHEEAELDPLDEGIVRLPSFAELSEYF